MHMDNIDREKYLKKLNRKKDNEIKSEVSKYIKNFITRTLICISLFLVLAIFCKSNIEYKDYMQEVQIYHCGLCR